MDEKRDKKEDNSGVVADTEFVEKNAYEISTCEWLINYFKGVAGIIPEKKEAPTTTPQQVTTVDSKLDEDIKKGNLKEIQDNDDEFIIGISTKKKANKQKGGKSNKQNKKVEQKSVLLLDISIMSQIKDVGLKAPNYNSEIVAFIDILTKRKDEMVEENKKALEAEKEKVSKEEKEEKKDMKDDYEDLGENLEEN